MALDQIKNMASEIEALKSELAEAKEELKGDIEASAAERVKQFQAEKKLSDSEIADAKKALQAMYLKSVALEVPMNTMEGYEKAAAVIEKAVVPADVSAWAAEAFSNEVIEDLELELAVSNLFGKIEMPDGIQTFSIPARTADLTAYLIAPAADAVESAITAGKVSFTVSKFKTFTTIADETNKEIVASVVDLSKKELVRGIARGYEDAVINGDTTFATANSPKKAFDGLRKIANANATDMGGAAVTIEKINETRKSMGSYGINPSRLAMIVNPNVFYQLLTVTDANGNLVMLTADKMGNDATLRTGVVGRIFGIDVVVSEYIANNLETSGADDAGTGATTEVLLINTEYFTRVTRGGFMVETDRNIVNSTNAMTGGMYASFGKLYTSGTPAAALVNVLP